MADFSTRIEVLDRGAVKPPARRLILSALMMGAVLAAVLIGAALGTPPSGSIGEAFALKAFADSPRREAVRAMDVMTIVPADVLGTDLPWSPLTGDGSN